MNIASSGHTEIAKTIDLIELPIFVLGINGDLVTYEKVNACYERTVGLKNSHFAGKTVYDLLPRRAAASLEKNYLRCLRTRAPFKYEELLQIGMEERWWETTLNPVFDDNGAIIRIMGSAYDITAHKHMIMDGVKSLAAACKRNDELHIFMTMAAHDLRPAVGNIKAINDLVLSNFTDLGDRKVEQVKLVSEIADGALESIEKTLHYARMIGLEEKPLERLDLNHCLSDLAALTDPTGAMKITYPAINVECEVVPIQMILRNLIENATRFAKTRIDISVSESSAKPGHLIFSISDDGPGFVGQKSGFESRLRHSDDKYSTTGFGLVAINQLVEQRDGDFWLGRSVIADGATLCFSLPGKILSLSESGVPIARAG